MHEKNSILDKIIQNKQSRDVYLFQPHEVINEFLKHLSNKEQEILLKRFGLSGNKIHTLEEIGKNHKITRERIRQIQNLSIKKIKEHTALKIKIEQLNQTITRLLQNFGGIMEFSHFLDEILAYSDKNDINKQAVVFLINEIFNEQIDQIKKTEYLMSGWKLKMLSYDIIHQILDILEDIIKRENRLLETDEILNHFKSHSYFKDISEQIIPFGNLINADASFDETIDRILISYLKISQKINQNLLGKWGLTPWPTISPKRMGDKIYLILTKIHKPLHFVQITEEINKAKLDDKIAYPPTIHNELIIDDRYVLVGRGIYALREWGYKEGTVSEVISDILKNVQKPMTKQEIIDEVSKRRIVKKSTIYLALSDKNKFKKVGDTYSLNTPVNLRI